MITLLVRSDMGRKAYRLRCRFKVAAFPSQDLLEKSKYKVAELFVESLAKQGWEYLDKHGFKMTGPFAPLVIVNLPKRHQQAQWHTKSSEVLANASFYQRLSTKETSYVSSVTPLTECEEWEFELAGVFVHKTLLAETPDPWEERKV